MPQLLHFLQVDKQTKIVGDNNTQSHSVEDSSPAAASTEEGETAAPEVTKGTFQNRLEHVRIPSLHYVQCACSV